MVIVFAMPGGGYDYVIDVENFTFSGDCQDISAVTLEGMVNAVADDAIAVGVAAGYPACSTASFVQSVHIWTVSCAERSGSACQTSFTPCGTNWCYRTYAVSCPGNGLSATITSAGGTASSCAQCSGEEACP
ncbi:MAG: hypothetical protein KDD67_15870 [Ignavibacteriae bacterium]|nr:hypothetical protein [Ignavibacteriota bacterium]MCB9215700.1 hypothetical protein [Ignavibacteria bacterium]